MLILLVINNVITKPFVGQALSKRLFKMSTVKYRFISYDLTLHNFFLIAVGIYRFVMICDYYKMYFLWLLLLRD